MKKQMLINFFIFSIVLSFWYFKISPIQVLKENFSSSYIEVSTKKYEGRNYDITNHIRIDEVKLTDNTGIYLTYGQSNSANFGEIGYDVQNEVYQSFNSTLHKYKDPVIGSDGFGGSVWGMVGDKLIEKGIHDKVIFSNCGWGRAQINQLNKDHYFGYLVLSYNSLIHKFGKVDGILFHQGESDNNESDIKKYYVEFSLFMKSLKENEIEIPIYISRVSLCGKNKPINQGLISIQNKLIKDFDLIKEGPNTDLLSESKYRLDDYCHFSLLGFEKFSEMWIESLNN